MWGLWGEEALPTRGRREKEKSRFSSRSGYRIGRTVYDGHCPKLHYQEIVSFVAECEDSQRVPYLSKTQLEDDKRRIISGRVLTISLYTVAVDAN